MDDSNSRSEPNEPIVQIYRDTETGGFSPCLEFLFTKDALATLIEKLKAIHESGDHFHCFTEDWGGSGLCNRRVIPELPLIHQINFRVIEEMPPDDPALRETRST